MISNIRQLSIGILLMMVTPLTWSQEQEAMKGAQEFPLSSDSLEDLNGRPENFFNPQSELKSSVAQLNYEIVQKQDVTAVSDKPEVILIPSGEIKTSYSGRAEYDAIFLLRRAINSNQLQFKDDNEYIPISNQQTVERIQSFIGQVVQNELIRCNVQSELVGDDLKFSPQESNKYSSGFIYKIDLGVNRLIISKTIVGASLIGEAEAKIFEQDKLVKKITVQSFGPGRVSLERFSDVGVESEVELKNAASKVVDYLAKKLGDRLCNFFN